ncbi:MAG: 50S ribosomal protein L16 [Candidatus Hydrothermarchaeales archaeon]
MTKRAGGVYRKTNKRSFTRKEYMGGLPGSLIVSYDMGNRQADFEIAVSLAVKEDVQITHNALEAARITTNRYLSKMIGVAGYYFKIRVHPHQILRENKMASGAGADRISQGMSLSFGKSISRAARLKKGQRFLTVKTSRENFPAVKSALRRAAMKIPCGSSIVIDKGKELLDF